VFTMPRPAGRDGGADKAVYMMIWTL
jgi:hypothetical protein